ncbi:MAG: metallophosphoesterase [Pseudomonadota bacterium]
MSRLTASNAEPLPPYPVRPLLVIGDVHGCLGLLDELLDKLAEDPVIATGAETDLVFVGDLVDRGPDTAGTLDRVQFLQSNWHGTCTVLLGNHEVMMMRFLDGEDPQGRWLTHGGRECLDSYGIEVPLDLAALDEDAMLDVADNAKDAIGPDCLDWLRSLPRMHRSGDVVVVHAAFDRTKDDDDQDERDLTWGNRVFMKGNHPKPPWVVHGHVITRPATVKGHRIAVDSGAYLSGDLSCAVIVPGEMPRFVSTDDNPELDYSASTFR